MNVNILEQLRVLFCKSKVPRYQVSTFCGFFGKSILFCLDLDCPVYYFCPFSLNSCRNSSGVKEENSKKRKMTGKVTQKSVANSANFRDQAGDINVCETVHSKTIFSGE